MPDKVFLYDLVKLGGLFEYLHSREKSQHWRQRRRGRGEKTQRSDRRGLNIMSTQIFSFTLEDVILYAFQGYRNVGLFLYSFCHLLLI